MKEFIDLAKVGGKLGREDTQGCWQNQVANYLNNCTVLDVGAGLGESKKRMGIRNIVVTTQDPAPDLNVDINFDIFLVPDNSFDVVTSFDVIEHIEDADRFARDMVRIARKWVFVTTPNIMHTGGTHVYHYKEYLPSEIIHLFEKQGSRFMVGWMMLPNPEGITQMPKSEFLFDKFCYNFCAGFEKL